MYPKHHGRSPSIGRKTSESSQSLSPITSSTRHRRSISRSHWNGLLKKGRSPSIASTHCDDGEDLTFLQFCTTCEKQIVTPGVNVLYCSEACMSQTGRLTQRYPQTLSHSKLAVHQEQPTSGHCAKTLSHRSESVCDLYDSNMLGVSTPRRERASTSPQPFLGLGSRHSVSPFAPDIGSSSLKTNASTKTARNTSHGVRKPRTSDASDSLKQQLYR
ncbi:hypothetical protein K470DRAFT_10374 [Piedraia hortae CBS 480.64]|uniref:Uncharacterized protein n=1 Tax=Piedraia hortae CBS 480.64 TaxID=1314780 RepID=A0A6A7C6Y5_9PEZI|nr:hypothetical protein K470DRAFT_10374 [Piedraia hortae CBS 480.64]